MTTLRVTVSATIECALQLDDSGMLKHHGLDAVPSTSRTRGTYTGEPKAILSLLEDLHSRGFGGGWDQPASWARACRAAYTRITKELAAQGYDITTEMEKVGRVAIPRLVLKQR